MDIDIVSVFDSILADTRSIDIAESEFKRMVYDDDALHKAYRRWCAEHDVSERRGFIEYCEERFDEEESCWDSLTDYDND